VVGALSEVKDLKYGMGEKRARTAQEAHLVSEERPVDVLEGLASVEAEEKESAEVERVESGDCLGRRG
jgi:hypothetical protein